VSHIIDHSHYHSNQVTSTLKDSHEVKQLHPHEECCESFNLSSQRIWDIVHETQSNCKIKTKRWQYIDIVPNTAKIRKTLRPELSNFILYEVGCKGK
jgi:hypothetical protein